LGYGRPEHGEHLSREDVAAFLSESTLLMTASEAIWGLDVFRTHLGTIDACKAMLYLSETVQSRALHL